MQYILLCTAIILEIIATTLLKTSEGFTKLLPAFGCIVLYICCFYAFSKALLRIEHDRSHRDRPDHRRLRDPESLRYFGKLTD